MRRFGILAVLLALAACGRSETPGQMAAQGQIDENAPIKVALQISIAAPPAKVWGILSNIGAWPTWQSDITNTAVDGVPGDGVLFSWTAQGTSVHSRIQLFQPDRALAWTGTVVNFHAIHVWTLTALPGGGTLVSERESLTGWFISLFYSSAELQQVDQRWLTALKVAAEH
jgi:uncharacterized protein YndB with AHSA1/START domain